MNNHARQFLKSGRLALVAALMLFAGSCATQKIDWNTRVASYTFDQAIMDFGPPDKHARLENGTVVAEWLTSRGYTQTYIAPSYYHGRGGRYYGPVFPTVVDTSSPDYFLRLTFGPDGKLTAWKKFAR